MGGLTKFLPDGGTPSPPGKNPDVYGYTPLPGGPLIYTGVQMCAQNINFEIRYTPKHILVVMQNSPHKQGFCGILPQI